MKKALTFIALLAISQVARSEITSIITFPGGSSGEAQFNSNDIFEGSSYVVFSTTSEKLLILTPPVGSTTTLNTYCSSATHIGRLLISSSSTSGQWVYVCESSGNWIQQGGSGGAGTPGGSDTQLQYNNAGSFGGIATATFGVTNNTLTIGATTTFTSVTTTTWQNVTAIVIGDGALMDFSNNRSSSTTSGLRVPQTTDCSSTTVEGQMCWDTDNDLLYVAGSAPTIQFPNRGTLTVGTTLYPAFLYVGSSATIPSLAATSIRFPDGTVQVSSPAAGVAGAAGSTIYNATSTAGFPFGFSASTGNFTSSVTITTPGRLLLPDGTDALPSLSRSSNKSTGVNLRATGVDLVVSGNSKINVEANQIYLQTYTRIDDNTISSTNSVSVLYFAAPVSDSNYYMRYNIDHQPADALLSREFSYGSRDKPGEDQYFFLAPVDALTGFALADVVHVNMSTFSALAGNFGINVSTPLAKLSVGGHIQIATGTSTNPTLSGCGTSPSFVNPSYDGIGEITIGTGGVATSCTVTFGTAWTNAPVCDAWHEGAILFVRPVTTTTSLVIDAATPLTASGKLKYKCWGRE